MRTNRWPKSLHSQAEALLALPFETMDRRELTGALAEIGQMEGAA